MLQLDAALRLDGRVALVTGGSTGIGRCCAEYLLAAGASVCLVARNGERLAAAVDELGVDGGRVIGVSGSVSDASVRDESVRRCVDELGGLHILINNAAGSLGGPLMDVREEDLRESVRLNQEVPLLYAQMAWRAWMAEHGGAIVNLSSHAGVRPRAGLGWYGTTKAALSFLTQSMALEMAPKVRVNALAPSMIVTETLLEKTTPEGRAEQAARRPLGVLGDPAQIAFAVLVLVSDASKFTTGQVIAIEGGSLLV